MALDGGGAGERWAEGAQGGVGRRGGVRGRGICNIAEELDIELDPDTVKRGALLTRSNIQPESDRTGTSINHIIIIISPTGSAWQHMTGDKFTVSGQSYYGELTTSKAPFGR